jgi:hypothetical protein
MLNSLLPDMRHVHVSILSCQTLEDILESMILLFEMM